MIELTKLKSNIQSGSNELFRVLDTPEERKLLEDLTVEVLQLIKSKSLNIRQVLVLLELVQAEARECTLI